MVFPLEVPILFEKVLTEVHKIGNEELKLNLFINDGKQQVQYIKTFD